MKHSTKEIKGKTQHRFDLSRDELKLLLTLYIKNRIKLGEEYGIVDIVDNRDGGVAAILKEIK